MRTDLFRILVGVSNFSIFITNAEIYVRGTTSLDVHNSKCKYKCLKAMIHYYLINKGLFLSEIKIVME